MGAVRGRRRPKRVAHHHVLGAAVFDIPVQVLAFDVIQAHRLPKPQPALHLPGLVLVGVARAAGVAVHGSVAPAAEVAAEPDDFRGVGRTILRKTLFQALVTSEGGWSVHLLHFLPSLLEGCSLRYTRVKVSCFSR